MGSGCGTCHVGGVSLQATRAAACGAESSVCVLLGFLFAAGMCSTCWACTLETLGRLAGTWQRWLLPPAPALPTGELAHVCCKCMPTAVVVMMADGQFADTCLPPFAVSILHCAVWAIWCLVRRLAAWAPPCSAHITQVLAPLPSSFGEL